MDDKKKQDQAQDEAKDQPTDWPEEDITGTKGGTARQPQDVPNYEDTGMMEEDMEEEDEMKEEDYTK